MGSEKSDLKNRTLSFLEKFKSEKKLQYLVVLIIIIILFSSIFIGGKTNKSTNESTKKDEVSVYVADLERRLSSTLSKVSGVGTVSVVITVESGMETVLATKKTTTETSSGIEIEETPIIINGKTVVIKEAYPKIIGVLIVAKGAENFSVMARIQQAVISLLNIDLNQIEILTMN